MVYRVLVEKKPELANDARSLLNEAKQRWRDRYD